MMGGKTRVIDSGLGLESRGTNETTLSTEITQIS